MAIGGLDRAGRREQLKGYVRCLVRSGYRSADDVEAEAYAAVLAEEADPQRAQALTSELLTTAYDDLAAASASWPEVTAYDRLRGALVELSAHGVVVLEYVDDHWAAAEALERRSADGTPPVGIAFFTASDVWHAVEHGMLEINLWHGDSANVAPGDALLSQAIDVLERHGIPATFDEGRIEAIVAWERRPGPAGGSKERSDA